MTDTGRDDAPATGIRRKRQRCISLPEPVDEAYVELAAARGESVSKLAGDVLARAIPSLRAAQAKGSGRRAAA